MRRNESTISTSICQNTCAREKYILRAHKFGGKQGYQIGRFPKSGRTDWCTQMRYRARKRQNQPVRKLNTSNEHKVASITSNKRTNDVTPLWRPQWNIIFVSSDGWMDEWGLPSAAAAAADVSKAQLEMSQSCRPFKTFLWFFWIGFNEAGLCA